MTIQQLEYIVALANQGTFVSAAEHCFVTQPTLSMQIQKVEDGLGVKLFDRSKQPVIATEAGELVLIHARKIIAESKLIKESLKTLKGEISGHLSIGVIPTLAPYLLPRFMSNFLQKYPLVRVSVVELTTAEIISRLRNDSLDCGILATPLAEVGIRETPLFYEPFVAYVSKKSSLYNKTTITPDEIDAKEAWLLADGHCMRSQVLQICLDKQQADENLHLTYEAGSVETLRKIVESESGMTILPELSIEDFNAKQRAMVRYFKTPEPVREISIVTHRDFAKQQLIKVLADTIKINVPDKMLSKNNREKIWPK